MLGASAARQIHQLMATQDIRGLEDGPVGGTLLHFGDDVIGQAIEADLPSSGSWSLARISDLALAQSAYQLTAKNQIWLPGMKKSEAINIPMTTVEKIGEIGPYHADINGLNATGGIRGPFEIKPVKATSAPTYPVIWSHDAENQRNMSFSGDSEGRPRKGKDKKEQTAIDEKVASVWSTASHCHFSRDFRFNSQSTSMQFTPRRTIGGRAWISIKLSSAALEKALVLWANTSLGLLMHWYHANKQQSGRGSIGVLALKDMPVLDVTELRLKQLERAEELFDLIGSDLELLPLNEIDEDSAREELDTKFAQDVLGLPATMFGSDGPLELLRMKLSREPSIRGHKAG
jgi:hypothetical protein